MIKSRLRYIPPLICLLLTGFLVHPPISAGAGGREENYTCAVVVSPAVLKGDDGKAIGQSKPYDMFSSPSLDGKIVWIRARNKSANIAADKVVLISLRNYESCREASPLLSAIQADSTSPEQLRELLAVRLPQLNRLYPIRKFYDSLTFKPDDLALAKKAYACARERKAANSFASDAAVAQVALLLRWHTHYASMLRRDKRPNWLQDKDISLEHILSFEKELKAIPKPARVLMGVLAILQTLRREPNLLGDKRIEEQVKALLPAPPRQLAPWQLEKRMLYVMAGVQTSVFD